MSLNKGKHPKCCGMKMRRKPNKQPPQYYCNKCKKHITLTENGYKEGKRKNLIEFHGKIAQDVFPEIKKEESEKI